MLGWLKNRRRRKLLAKPFPEAWLPYMAGVRYYRAISEPDQERLRVALRIFIAEREWEGIGGLEITVEMQVTVATMACLLILGMEGYYFDNVPSILITPETFVVKE